MSQTSSLNR